MLINAVKLSTISRMEVFGHAGAVVVPGGWRVFYDDEPLTGLEKEGT
jgi:hypothetical protein